MKIGLTYDLRSDYLALGYSAEQTAEFDRPDTIDAIERALQVLGHRTERIGRLAELVGKLGAGQRWDLVFNIAEGLHGFAREAQVPALLEAYEIPHVFSDALVLALTLHKGLTKHVVRDVGLPTPDFRIVHDAQDADAVDLPFPLFVKPVAEGTARGIDASNKVRDQHELRRVCRRVLEQCDQPVLVEVFLPGREFTVGIVGSGADARAIGTMEVALRESAEADAYTYLNKEHCEELVTYSLADGALAREAEELSLAAWRALGCRDGGRVDVRADHLGRMHFLEVNPLAGLHPEHSDLPILCTMRGIPYQELIRMIMDSALARLPALPKSASGAMAVARV